LALDDALTDLAWEQRGRSVEALIGLAVSGRPIQPLVAEGRSAERRPRLTRPNLLGPRWVRVATVEHGQQRSPTVANGSEEPQVAGPAAQAAGMMQVSDSDCGPEGQESSLLGSLLNREELDLHFQGRELPTLGLY
jgi:hypothetical protein